MPTTNFSTGKKQQVLTVLGGLDKVTQLESIKDGRTPEAKNFRLYQQTTAGRETAVSTRRGPGEYVAPIGEALKNSFTTLDTNTITMHQSDIYVIPFTTTFAGVLTKFGIHGAAGEGGGVLRIDIYSGTDYVLDEKLSESSISVFPETADWVYARFINSIDVGASTQYYAVIYLQDDADDGYELTLGNGATNAGYSNSGIIAVEEQDYGFPFRVYCTTKTVIKGSYRFNRDSSQNKTLVAIGTTMYVIDESTGTYSSIATGLSSSATEYSFTDGDGKVFWVNGYDSLKAWDGTTVETITDTELPILREITFHKDRLFGVTAADKNKIVFSENPGNPSDLAANLQWYHAWLSVSFIYIPRPKNGSPITKIISFQDTLVIFTQDGKYVLSGSDRGDFYLRDATGFKGAISRKGVTRDENNVYFVAKDGFYKWSGNDDTKISDAVQPVIDECPRPLEISLAFWKNQLRAYMSTPTSLVNDICLIKDTIFDEWMMDTKTYIDSAIRYDDADDNGELIEFSSQNGAAYYAEQDFDSLGAPIDFDYRLKYNSMGVPAQRKKIKRFFPIVQAVGGAFNIIHGLDKDMVDAPKEKTQFLASGGTKIGSFTVGDGTQLGGDTRFKPKRVSVSGNSRLFQYRISRNGVGNQVAFMGVQLVYKLRNL